MLLKETVVTYKVTRHPSLNAKKIVSSRLAFEIFNQVMTDRIVEYFYVIYMNSGSGYIGHSMISKGGIAGTVADLRIILRDALLCGATAMICAHNHPSGNLKPSEQDIRLTRKLKEAGDLMDVKLLDHILLGDQLCTEFYSFADQGVVF